MSKTDKLGYTCQCGQWNPCVSGWAAAHWREVLVHKCEGCHVRMVIQNGNCLGPDS